jgi:hypothetical protein
VKKRLSPIMTRRSPGTPQPEEDLYGLKVRPLTPAERAEVDKKLAVAAKALPGAGPGLLESPPDVIAAMLQVYAQKLPKMSPPPTKPILKAMGVLFCEQLARSGAQWMMRCVDDDADLRLYSGDRSLSIGPDRIVERLLEADMRRCYSLEGVYKAFKKVARKGDDFEKVLAKGEVRHLAGSSIQAMSWGIWHRLPPWP